jgi:hypothetical protein
MLRFVTREASPSAKLGRATDDESPRIDPPTAALMEGAAPGGTAGRTIPYANPDATARRSTGGADEPPGEGDVNNLPG